MRGEPGEGPVPEFRRGWGGCIWVGQRAGCAIWASPAWASCVLATCARAVRPGGRGVCRRSVRGRAVITRPRQSAGNHADRLVSLEQRLIFLKDPPDRRLHPGRQRLRPDLRGQPAEMFAEAAPRQPGQDPVDPPEAQIGTEEREPDRGLAQQGGEQRRVGDVQPGHLGLGCRGVSAHRLHRSSSALRSRA